MDKILVSMLQRVWGRNIIYSVLGILVSAIVSLACFSAKMVSEVSLIREASKQEIVASEKHCAARIESIQTEQIKDLKAALKKQDTIERYIEQLKKKKK